ncbi:MAG: DUF1156 domain-containing protein [Saprospiraceae bacterium]|nr:DUF1156 domain-containing protein [Saprospiraceae bacterium]
MITRTKLIEVALPLDAINHHSAREKSIRHGHPSTLHLWWARRPLAAARAVLFAQLVDDPSAVPEEFPTEAAQNQERQRLFHLLEALVQWENTQNEALLERARAEIRRSWQRACRDNAQHPDAATLFHPDQLPPFHDPFAGGGAIPLEAQRLGLRSYASDLNPVAVLINKAMIEIPPRFANLPPINPEYQQHRQLFPKTFKAAQGLAQDVLYYGLWMRNQALQRIGHLYPPIEITPQMAYDRPDLQPLIGQKLTPIAWLWVRTVKSPNPAFANVHVPLASSFLLSAKTGKEAYVEPIVEHGDFRFVVKVKSQGTSFLESVKRGTKAGGSGTSFFCLMSRTPITFDYIRSEAKAGRMGVRLMAIVAEGERGRVYLSPLPEHETIAKEAVPSWKPETNLPKRALGFRVQEYGMTKWADLFTPRQLVALSTFSDLVGEAIEQAYQDALAAGMPNDETPLHLGGQGAQAYAEAVGVYLAFAVDKCADYWSAICTWHSSGEKIRNTFSRQAIPMTWDYAEANPMSDSTGNWAAMVEWVWKVVEMAPAREGGEALQAGAQAQTVSVNKVISTDPPYYDNIGYADLSDFFYVWLRRSLRKVYPDLLATVTVPKAEELVATPYRHGSKEAAERFFLEGMTRALGRLAEQAHPAFPITIYYAFKQTESDGNGEVSSTGWETFLEALLSAGLTVSGTWPMRTELGNRILSQGTNALASSIVLVCRRRSAAAPEATRREFLEVLRRELGQALRELQQANIAPVDLAQAAIGPGMRVFSQYGRVLDASGRVLRVRDALALINQLLGELLAEQEGDFDADTRWAVTWFMQHGFESGNFGEAETLSKAKNTSVEGLVEAGILEARGGKVRLLRPEELPTDWDPSLDTRLTIWEALHHLLRVLGSGGQEAAADLLNRLKSARAEAARELAYRLFRACEENKRAADATRYNELVQEWPHIAQLARQLSKPANQQGELFQP